jgi:glycosyltransferase involved in cell wall biosynthesis
MGLKILQSIERDVFESYGSPIRVLEISRNLGKRKGFGIFVNSMGRIKSVECRKIGGIEFRRIPFIPVRTYELKFLLNTSRIFRLDERVAEERGIDIIHSHLFESSCAASLIKKKHGIPFIYDMHTLFPEELLIDSKSYTKRLRTLPWTPVESALRRHADHIVATSDTMRDYLYRHGCEHVTSVPVGVNSDFFRPGPPDEKIIKEYGLEGKNVVTYTGNTNPYQGVGDMIEAVPQVVKENRDVVFFIVGGGESLEYYKRRARTLGVGDRVIFTGPQDYSRMPSFISVADITLSLRTSTFTGNITFPTKLTTYMSAGKPSICTRTGDQERILERFEVGYLVDSGSPGQLAEKIICALSDEKRLKRLGKNARLAAEREFSWDVLCEKYIKIYKGILHGEGG